MVIMEMIKEFTSGEAFIVQPHKVVHWIDPDFIKRTPVTGPAAKTFSASTGRERHRVRQ